MIQANPVAVPVSAGLPRPAPLRVAATGAARNPALDRLAELARRLFEAPMAVVSLFDPACGRQVIRGQSGLSGRWAARVSVPRALGFCEQVRRNDLPLVVDDARRDPRGRGLPVLADLGVTAYLGAPLHDETGGAAGVFSVIDRQPRRWGAEEVALLGTLAATVDEQLRLGAELAAEAAKRPQAVRRDRGRFAAGLGRDLRLQAHAVLDLAAEIDEAPDPPPLGAVTAAIRLAGADLLAVAEDLRELARLAGGRAAALGDVLVPAEVLEGLDPAHRVAARGRGLRLVVDVDGDGRVPRRGDPVRLRQVLDHFLAAALMRAALGEVVLRLDLGRADRIGVEIVDPGPAPAAAAGALPPLGELLAEARIALIGGRIDRLAAPGGGTRVWLDLPMPVVAAAAAAPAAVAARAAVAAAAGNAAGAWPAGQLLRGRRLLVAEATPTIRRLIEVILSRAGAEVVAVPAAEAAVVACGTGGFDAVLVDIGLAGPAAEGGDTCAPRGAGLVDRFHAATAGRVFCPPVIALSTGTAAARSVALDAGFAAALPRPLDPVALVETVARLFEPGNAGPH